MNKTIFCAKFGPTSFQKLLKFMAMDSVFVIFCLFTIIFGGKAWWLTLLLPLCFFDDLPIHNIKGYLCQKTILCHKTALDVQLMNFFIGRKNKVSFLRYRDFCVFVKPADFKICDVIISIAAKCKLHLCIFLLNPKSYPNEIWSNTSVLYGKHF